MKKKNHNITEDEMVGWHHPLDGHESEQTLEDRIVNFFLYSQKKQTILRERQATDE